jgi:hypothetical protein
VTSPTPTPELKPTGEFVQLLFENKYFQARLNSTVSH